MQCLMVRPWLHTEHQKISGPLSPSCPAVTNCCGLTCGRQHLGLVAWQRHHCWLGSWRAGTSGPSAVATATSATDVHNGHIGLASQLVKRRILALLQVCSTVSLFARRRTAPRPIVSAPLPTLPACRRAAPADRGAASAGSRAHVRCGWLCPHTSRSNIFVWYCRAGRRNTCMDGGSACRRPPGRRPAPPAVRRPLLQLQALCGINVAYLV